jgi:hypothetical protein
MGMLNLPVLLSGLVALAMVCGAVLRGWSLWLALKMRELEAARPAINPSQRIELADLKERIRKLEAIAAGVDL